MNAVYGSMAVANLRAQANRSKMASWVYAVAAAQKAAKQQAATESAKAAEMAAAVEEERQAAEAKRQAAAIKTRQEQIWADMSICV